MHPLSVRPPLLLPTIFSCPFASTKSKSGYWACLLSGPSPPCHNAPQETPSALAAGESTSLYSLEHQLGRNLSHSAARAFLSVAHQDHEKPQAELAGFSQHCLQLKQRSQLASWTLNSRIQNLFIFTWELPGNGSSSITSTSSLLRKNRCLLCRYECVSYYLYPPPWLLCRILAVNLCVDCSIAGCVKKDRSFVFTPKRTETDSFFQKLAEICGRGAQLACRGKHVAVQHRLITGWEASHSTVGSQEHWLCAAPLTTSDRLLWASLAEALAEVEDLGS